MQRFMSLSMAITAVIMIGLVAAIWMFDVQWMEPASEPAEVSLMNWQKVYKGMAEVEIEAHFGTRGVVLPPPSLDYWRGPPPPNRMWEGMRGTAYGSIVDFPNQYIKEGAILSGYFLPKGAKIDDGVDLLKKPR